MTNAVAAPLLAGLVAFITVGSLSRWRGRGAVLDHPGHRSLHKSPTPRLGGVGIAVGAVCGLLWLAVYRVPPLSVLVIAVPLFCVSIWEDLRPLPALVRLAAQLFISAAAAASFVGTSLTLLPGVSWMPGLASWAVIALAVVWMTNLYNFMDGMDGLAGGMGTIGFGVIGFACWRAGANDIADQAWVIAAACGGFLPWNLPPARIFMGDAGAIPLGFLAATLGLEAASRAVLPLWFTLLVFSPFLVDATLTLAARLRRGERVWQAHRSHYYQRLVLANGGRHRPVLLAEVALMLACGASGIILLDFHSKSVQWAGLAGWGAVYAVLAIVARGASETHVRD